MIYFAPLGLLKYESSMKGEDNYGVQVRKNNENK